MANPSDKWYFTKEQLDQTPSRKCGYDSFKELSYRQQTANFIQDMGQRLKVSQLCINTAIVYMHRFYVFHSFTNFPWHQMAAAALFLAAKVEEQPRKLEYVIRVANMCRNNRDTNIDINSERYTAQSQDLVFNEHVLLQTLGFDVAIDHPHTHVVRCCHLVRASKDLAQSSYFLASNSLHLTTMCLQYKPTVVACFCIHLASKWSSWEIPLSTEKKEWFLYVDPTVTAELLQQLTAEFFTIFENCPSRLKEKIMSIGDNGMQNCTTTITNSPFDTDPKKIPSTDQKDGHSHRSHDSKSSSESDPHKHRSSRPHDSSSSQQQREREYREKKEREKLAVQQHGLKTLPPGAPPQQKQSSSHHHRPPVDPNKVSKPHSRPPPTRPEPRDILREAARDSPFGIATKDYNLAQKSSDKDGTKTSSANTQQRDYLVKANARVPDLNKVPINKHEQVRRHEDNKFVKPPVVQESSDSIKRHSSVHGYANKTNSTSQQQQHKVGAANDNKSSVLKQQPPVAGKVHHHNGSGVPIKEEVKEEPKMRSLFSPEKSPEKTTPTKVDSLGFPQLSPLESPTGGRRVRNYSTSSEPELRPVMKKIDQVEGFENLMRDSTIGINKLHQIPDIITPINDIVKEESTINFSKEMKPPDIIPPLCSEHNISASQPIVNGIETNPMLISSLLKETPSVPHLPVVTNSIDRQEQPEPKLEPKEHHHKSKKKNKEKHKHKDKSKDDKEKKKKHKDKDREKHKHKHETTSSGIPEAASTQPTEPIKIKIQKDKIPIKIKIPKDVISKTEELPSATPAPIGLKIKIPRDVINNCEVSEKGRKRERERGGSPPAKVTRLAPKDTKQNGRHSYTSKVTQLGDGDASIRLAESKYINKNSSL